MRWLLWLVLAFAIACSRGGSSAASSTVTATGEPFYTPGVSTLLWRDNMDGYVSALASWTNAQSSSYAGFTLAPYYPLESADQLISPGRGGAGKAWRVAYQGVVQESHNIWLYIR